MLRDEIADQLIYATTKITGTNGVNRWFGTGFFMINSKDDNLGYVIKASRVLEMF